MTKSMARKVFDHKLEALLKAVTLMDETIVSQHQCILTQKNLIKKLYELLR